MRKKKGLIPEQSLTHDAITMEMFCASMRNLMNNPDFTLLRRFWLNTRGEILEQGKEKPSEAQWSRLRGFDDAIMVPEKYAAKSGKSPSNELAQELQQTLNG